MTQKEIYVGIVGADTKASWAKVSHVPAVNGLPGLKLAAVASSELCSAAEMLVPHQKVLASCDCTDMAGSSIRCQKYGLYICGSTYTLSRCSCAWHSLATFPSSCDRLCDAEEAAFLRDIEKLIRMSIPATDHPSAPGTAIDRAEPLDAAA